MRSTVLKLDVRSVYGRVYDCNIGHRNTDRHSIKINPYIAIDGTIWLVVNLILVLGVSG